MPWRTYVLLVLTGQLVFLGCGHQEKLGIDGFSSVNGDIVIAAVARDGDKVGDVVFDRDKFSRRRAESLEADSGDWAASGFTWIPLRIFRNADETEAEFQARKPGDQASRRRDPWSPGNFWLRYRIGIEDVEREVTHLTSKDLEGVKATNDPENGRGILLRVTAEGRDRLMRFMALHAGRWTCIAVGGEAVFVGMLFGPLDREIPIHSPGMHPRDQEEIFKAIAFGNR